MANTLTHTHTHTRTHTTCSKCQSLNKKGLLKLQLYDKRSCDKRFPENYPT